MRSLTQVAFKTLAEYRKNWCVSLYMPTDPARLESRKDSIRLRNMLADAEKILRERGMRSPDIRKMFADADSLSSDGDLWRDPLGGLAMFIAPGFFRYYRTQPRLEKLLVVAGRFHLRPLMKADRKLEAFHVLTLSQNKVALFLSTPDGLEDVPLPHVPTSLEEALQFEEGEKQLQHHVVPRARGGGGQAIYHGHGSMFPDEKDSILQFFRKVDAGISGHLKTGMQPLVLVGVDYIRALYQQASEYPHIMETGIAGNADGMSPRTLHERAKAIVAPHFLADMEKALKNYQHNRQTLRTSDLLEVILPAAMHGQVETLFVAEDAACWGHFDVATLETKIDDLPTLDSEDLVDLACVRTAVNSGDVLFLPREQMPDELDLAATFFYEIERV